MKIGLICPYNVTLGGGVQEVVFALQQHLSGRGHIVKILTARPARLGKIDRSAMIFVGNAIDLRWPNHTTAPLSSEINPELIDQVLNTEKFDILHFHEPWVPVLSRQILARSHSINIGTFHAKVPETIVNRTLSAVVTPYLRTVLKDLHSMTAVSEPAAEFVSSMTDRPIAIIPNGIELDHFATHNSPQSSIKKILYIGRLERRKGVKYLIYAYHVLAQTDHKLRLIIAGDGPDRHMLEMLVASLGTPGITFLGHISDAKKKTLLASADLFCSPAIYGESFGIVLLEAMASGLPAVAGNNAGYTALLKGVGALSLVSPKDTPEFARRLRLLLDETVLRDAWTTWATHYIQQFTYDAVTTMYEAAYAQALQHLYNVR